MRRKSALRERDCANPRCHNTLDSFYVPDKVRYCTACQIAQRDIKNFLPAADGNDLHRLLVHGGVNMTAAARILGLPLPTLAWYCQENHIRSFKYGRYRVINLNELFELKELIHDCIRLSVAARILKIKFGRLQYLAEEGHIKIIRTFRKGRLVRRRDLPMIAEINKHLQLTAKQRRKKSLRAKSNGDEFSTRDIAIMLGLTLCGVEAIIRRKSLSALKKGRYLFVTKKNIYNFCLAITSKKMLAKTRVRQKAQNYLDSLAAGN